MECGAHRSHGYELCDNDRQGLRECIRKTGFLKVAKERVANVREIVPGNGHDKMGVVAKLCVPGDSRSGAGRVSVSA